MTARSSPIGTEEPAGVDVASLAAFRALFGAILFVAIVRFVAKGWVSTQLVAPPFHFTYAAFSFVRPWAGAGMYVHFAVLALAALGIALGAFYRTSAVAFFLGFTYAELIDAAAYLNHYYLGSLLSGLLALTPADGAFSVDAWRRPDRRTSRVPAWLLTVLRFQVGVVYVYAGIAKLNADWLLHAQPLRIWLAAGGDVPLLGGVLAQPGTAFVASWAGAAFDLGIVGFLLSPRTRRAAFATAILFHGITGLLLPIGMFPWIMLAALTVFLPPDWPRALARRFGAPGGTEPGKHERAGRLPALRALLVAHCFVQAVLPLRGGLDLLASAWSGSGFNFAWKLMIVEKVGHVVLRVRDRATGQIHVVRPAEYLAPWQERAMAQDPEMIRALARHVAGELAKREGRDVAVFADAFASLNGRPSARLVDPDVDLTRAAGARWILPLPD